MSTEADSDRVDPLIKSPVEPNEASDGGSAQLREQFDRQLAEHRSELLSFLERRIGSKLGRRVDVHDLLQETCLAAFQGYPRYIQQPSLPLRIWLLRTAQQQLINAYRRHLSCIKRSVFREEEWNDCSSAAIAAGLIASGSSPSNHLQFEELKAKLEGALEELSQTDREVLLMRHFESRPYADIALLLDMDENAVRQRFGRALLRLREITKRLGLLDHLS